MQVRAATVADIPAMHRIRLAVRENRLAHPASVHPRHYEAMLVSRGKGWVAESGTDIVGFAVGDLSNGSGWALFVDPRHEGRGAGRALHDAMVQWFFGQGVDSVTLTTTPGTRAEKFYRASGWRCTGPTPGGEARYELSRASWVQSGGPGRPSTWTDRVSGSR